ncbi:TMV resistance protein N-like [Pistacia vera]|uniref:TMV resistance protein N-like n=1 Tax=Pistacia vera TaxID=55513 RepID=UPI001262D4DD|nr:TMV resistance protein N-like [Pistacia vera]XP_031280178.1 TMV resistance protein N-like [Pistacia vera]XP_031280185.1 TMV resistance protein N-like [Pistacia vera]
MASSPSSGFDLVENYDVFISFRGVDTRHNFVSHLYSNLSRNNIKTFTDDQLIRGHEIQTSLSRAIERSTIAVVVFSEHYGSSRVCLKELEEIYIRRNMLLQIVVPVFYHVEPTEVRNQCGPFGEAFAELENSYTERADRWKTALRGVANLSGWVSSAIRHEAVLVQQIVSDILAKLNRLSPVGETNLGGVNNHIENIESLLSIGSQGVFMLGILGTVGVGVSTIASAIYDKIHGQFDRYCFIGNVGKRAESINGLISLRQDIQSSITLVDTNSPTNELPSTMKKSGRKKVLIILDKVTRSEQIEFSIRDFLSFLGQGSQIIITTGDEQVLKGYKVDRTYEVEGLLHAEALALFNLYAFGDHIPEERYLELSEKIIEYAKGSPLVLKILGSLLSGKSPLYWERILSKLGTIPRIDLQEVLKICYEELDDEEKKIFLDISSLLNGGDINFIIRSLKAWNNFPPERGINALVNKHFITILNDKVVMDDSLQDLGREIRQEKNRRSCL